MSFNFACLSRYYSGVTDLRCQNYFSPVVWVISYPHVFFACVVLVCCYVQLGCKTVITVVDMSSPTLWYKIWVSACENWNLNPWSHTHTHTRKSRCLSIFKALITQKSSTINIHYQSFPMCISFFFWERKKSRLNNITIVTFSTVFKCTKV